MTRKDFFEKLAERAASGLGFDLDGDGYIREKRTRCCPVVAVARRLKRGSCPGWLGRVDHYSGADVLGMDYDTASAIADAADNDCSDVRRKWLRRRLLAACGLTSAASN